MKDCGNKKKMNKKLVVALLENIASEAKILAMQVERGANWPGDLASGINVIIEKAHDVRQEIRDDR